MVSVYIYIFVQEWYYGTALLNTGMYSMETVERVGISDDMQRYVCKCSFKLYSLYYLTCTLYN